MNGIKRHVRLRVVKWEGAARNNREKVFVEEAVYNIITDRDPEQL